MNQSVKLNIGGVEYQLQQKPADRWGHLRFNTWKEGQDKPYSLSVSDTLYKDSKIPGYGCSCKGWIYHRKCKHITALHQFLNAE